MEVGGIGLMGSRDFEELRGNLVGQACVHP